MQIIAREGKLITDLYLKQTDPSSDPSSCHPYNCTKLIRYSQALKMNRFCLENVSFDLPYKELEECLVKRNYNSTVVRKQILKTRLFPGDNLLGRDKEVKNNDVTVLTLTCHRPIKNFQNVLNET